MAYAYDMIQETIPYVCRRCGSPDIVKNGTNKCGRSQYYCHACGAHRTLTPKRPHAAQFKSLILKTYHERASLHGLERIFHVSRQTVAHWLRTILRTVPKFQQTVLPAQPGDVLELDEVWSFVLKKRPETVVMDRPVSADTPSGRVYNWRPQREDLSPTLEQTADGLQALSVI